MKTPLPTPHYFTTYDFDGAIVYRPYSTPEELKAYGAAEYARALQEAANLCHDMHYSSDEQAMGQAQCAHAISKLGEANEKVEVPAP